MPRPDRGAARLRRCAHALVLPFVLPFVLFVALSSAPSRAAVSPFPPIALGNVAVGAQLQADVVVPLSMTVAQIPSAYDAQVVFTSGDALQDAALALVSLTSPVTVAQLKAQHPAWGIAIAAPTGALADPSGMYALTPLGCDANQCTFRATYAPTAPGVHTAQLTATVASITFNEGGLLGTLVNLFVPFLLGIVNASLVFDFTASAFAVTAAAPGVPVPVGGVAWLGGLAALVAAAGMLGAARRRRR